MANGFDVNAARQAGYSDDEILQHLTQSRKFDVNGALQAGYSKADIIGHLASTPAPQGPPKPPPSQPNAATGWAAGALAGAQAGGDFAKGALSGAASTVFHGGDLIRRGWNATVGAVAPSLKADRPIENPEVQQAMTPPPTPAGKLGKFAEQTAEFAIPGSAVAKAGRGLGLASRMALEGATAGGVSALQTGGDPTATAVGAATGAAAPAIAAAVKAVPKKIFRNVNNPVEEAALKSVENEVPMTVGQRTGNRGLQRLEQGLENLPGSSGRAHEFFANQQDDLANAFERRMTQQGGQVTNEVGAGQGIVQRLTNRISNLKNQADKVYGNIRQQTAANTRTVQTGTTTSPVMGPNGQPITTPVMRTFETPVPVDPVRAAMRPVFEELTRSMPEARRAASPAYQAVKNLMESGDQYMNAMDFDRWLGAVKAIARDGKNPYLTSQSQGIARSLIRNGEQQLQSALAGVNPNLPTKLQSARNMVKSYYEAGELLADLNGEPGALYKNLVSGGDRVFNTLTDLKRMAPNEVRTVGRTFLDGMAQKATAEGGFGRAAGLMADWQRLGPETKNLLFGPQLSSDITNFLIAAKRITRPQNPSGSAHTLAALAGLEAVSAAVAGVAGWAYTGDPKRGLAAGTAVGGAFLAPNLAARFLFSGNNAKLLTQAITAQPGSPAFTKAAALLNAAWTQFQQKNPNPQAPQKIAEAPVPDSPETNQIQATQLQQGDRRAVFYPRGSRLPKRPQGMKMLDTPDGMFYYDPSKTNSGEILSAQSQGRLNDILGAAEGGMGPQSKSDIAASGVPPVAVVGRAADGTQSQATLATPDAVPETERQVAKLTPPDGSVDIEDPEETIADRLKRRRNA